MNAMDAVERLALIAVAAVGGVQLLVLIGAAVLVGRSVRRGGGSR